MQSILRLDRMGVRFAGSAQEKEAGNWIRARFRSLPLTSVQVQDFPCTTFVYSRCRAEIPGVGKPLQIPCEPAAHSGSTPERGLSGRLVWVERMPSTIKASRRLFGGKIPILYCSEVFRYRRFRRLLAARPKAVLLVDDRFHGSHSVAIGFPRFWVNLINCPILSVPFSVAWELSRSRVD